MTKQKNISVVPVSLGSRSYPIYIGTKLLADAGKYCTKHKLPQTLVVITDSNVGRLYLSTLQKSLLKEKFTIRTIIIPAGEQQKSLGRAEKIFTQLLRWKIERDSAIIALGGGVIGDLAGFIAATFQRGIKFVQVPTSLLAQVDSSVGGKVGINHPLAKNMIGAFYQPVFVLADTTVLTTLPKREIVCGLGEIVKYGVIMDKKFFDYSSDHISDALKKNLSVFSFMVKRSCELKAYVVTHDEREQNLRAILNFGHTIGHALEQAGKYSYLKHGEAILYGMIAEARLAYAMGAITLPHIERIEETIKKIPLPVLSRLSISNRALINTMKMDKKVKRGKIRMVLPSAVGKVSLPVSIPENAILNSIDYLKN